MPISSADRLRYAEQDFAAVGTKAGKYAESDSLRRLHHGLKSLLAAATIECSDPASFGSFLERHAFLDWLRRHTRQTEVVASLVDQGAIESSVLDSGYDHLAFATAAWAIGARALGEEQLAFSWRRDIAMLSGKFWNEYKRAMQALVDRTPYEPTELKLRGLERYWWVYLELIAATTNDGDVDAAIERAQVAFSKRNRDGRLGHDSSGFEGTGYEPVSFDFRLEGILRYADRRDP